MHIILKLSNFRFSVPQITRNFSKNKKTDNTKIINLLKTMPKEPKHIAEAQKQRIKIKQKSSKYVPGKVTLQILGTGAKGAPRSVYLFSDQSRYLFNCGEGTQRLAHEHKTKLAKLEHIFITHPSWNNIGGLPGTALTIQDVGVPQITLHGPPGLNEIFSATRRFVIIRDLEIKMADCNEQTTFEDNVLSVKYVPLFRKNIENDNTDKSFQVSTEQSEASTTTRSDRRKSRKRSSSRSRNNEEMVEDNTDYYAHEQSGKRLVPDNSTTSDGQNILEETTKKGIAMSYICRLQPRPGMLNLEKCVEKGVPPGPLLGKLKSGEDVTLQNGIIVKSCEVCEPDDPGPVFLVVDCPSIEYLESLVTNSKIKSHQKFAKTDQEVAYVVIHFTPKDIVDLPEYKAWMDNFTPSTQHIMINETNTCMGSIAVHRIQHKLNMLMENLFPLLGDNGTPAVDENSDGPQNKKPKYEEKVVENTAVKSGGEESDENSFRKIGTLSSFHLRPKLGFDNSSEIKLDPQEYKNETLVMEEFPVALKDLEEKLRLSKSNLEVRDYPKILFLGTGSCIPNKTRNTSGILIQTDVNKNIIMDCGEGTYGQLVRFFGSEKADDIIANVGAIYISHLHADHHIGLIGFLQGRRRALNSLNIDRAPLYLFAPKQILTWLNFYDRCFENICDEFTLVPNDQLILNMNLYAESQKLQVLNDLDLGDISTCAVRHCPNSFGVSIIHKKGYKITYSGDTMPSDNLVELGKNSDILIHEATMEDELVHEAVFKMHSTTSQAIQVGKDMGAKHVILTHFSQRYAKLPRFNDNFAENVSIAFDNMMVKLDELPLVPHLYPALKVMFAEHCEEMEHKALKRQLKSEREALIEKTRARLNIT